MRRRDGLAYLTKDGGHLRTPCTPYGRTSAECAPVAWRVAYLTAKNTHEPMSLALLDWAMGLVVNDHPDVAHIVRQYGGGKYR